MPGGNFALSGFRVFGKGMGAMPDIPENFRLTRNEEDRRNIKLRWNKATDAIGYNISFGISKDKLYHNYVVYQDTTLEINSLSRNKSYFFAIESFNENGISQKGTIVMAE